MRGPIHRKQTLPLGPGSGKQPGLRLRGRLDCTEGPLGEQMGQEDGRRPGRGLCLYLLHHSHPHFGFWAEPRFEKSNSSSSAISRAVSKGACSARAGSGGSRDAPSVLACRQAGSHRGRRARWEASARQFCSQALPCFLGGWDGRG